MAFHDSLTGLPNRVSFNERLAADIARCKAVGAKLAVLSMDLNRFKDVNDLFGHGAGDRLLMQASQRMVKSLHDGEFLARFGGDEFIAVQFAPDQPGAAGEFAERLARLFDEPFAIDGNTLHVGTSIGIAIYPNDGTTSAHLLANAMSPCIARKATDKARSASSSARWTTPSGFAARCRTSSRPRSRRTNSNCITRCRNGSTPTRSAVSKRCCAGITPPAVLFRPRTSFRWPRKPGSSFQLANGCCARPAPPPRHGTSPTRSRSTFRRCNSGRSICRRVIHQILIETGLSPSRLEVEITESTLIENLDRALHLLRQIKALGVTIAMDDFGTGYSSLSTLHAFPFDKIKLDRSFVNKVRTDHQAAAIVRAVLSLGKNLHVPVLAEGVETQAHLDFLRDEKCDEVQGFLMGYPVPHDRIKALVTIGAPEAVEWRTDASEKSDLSRFLSCRAILANRLPLRRIALYCCEPQ